MDPLLQALDMNRATRAHALAGTQHEVVLGLDVLEAELAGVRVVGIHGRLVLVAVNFSVTDCRFRFRNS